jgi:RimJ/RimL family protein N-acetyltransferase
MKWAMPEVHIEDQDLLIKPLDPADFKILAEALLDTECIYALNWGIDTPAKIHTMLERNFQGRERGDCNPFSYWYKGEPVGISRFLNIDPTARCLEIGGTWVALRWRRTQMNTRVKTLLLQWCFEKLAAERVELRVNEKNYRSQLAVLRLGATFEGIMLRRHIPPQVEPMAMHLYSVIRPNWPRIRERLVTLLERRPIPYQFLPLTFGTPRLLLRTYELRDAEKLLALVVQNLNDLQEGFPKTSGICNLAGAAAAIAARQHASHVGTDFSYGVYLRADTPGTDSALIGQLTIKSIDWNLRAADIGYFIDINSRGHSFATEALRAMVAMLRAQHFRRITLRIFPDNLASFTVAKRLGFVSEGLLRQSFMDGRGQVRDVLLLSLLI